MDEYGQSLDHALALTQFDVWGFAYVLEAIDNTTMITVDEIICASSSYAPSPSSNHPQRQFEAGV